MSLFGRSRKSLGRRNNLKGRTFEEGIVRLMRLRGHAPVRRSVTMRDSFGHLSEIDVVAGYFRPIYIECKNYTGPVPLKDVAKFKEVLRLNRIPLRRALFVTQSTFVPRALNVGVRCIDGKQLARMRRWAPLVGLVRCTVRLALAFVLTYATTIVGVIHYNRFGFDVSMKSLQFSCEESWSKARADFDTTVLVPARQCAENLKKYVFR